MELSGQLHAAAVFSWGQTDGTYWTGVWVDLHNLYGCFGEENICPLQKSKLNSSSSRYTVSGIERKR